MKKRINQFDDQYTNITAHVLEMYPEEQQNSTAVEFVIRSRFYQDCDSQLQVIKPSPGDKIAYTSKENELLCSCYLYQLPGERNQYLIREFLVTGITKGAGVGTKFIKSLIEYFANQNSVLFVERSMQDGFWVKLGFKIQDEKLEFSSKELDVLFYNT